MDLSLQFVEEERQALELSMARKVIFNRLKQSQQPTFGDFVSAPIDVQYENRKSRIPTVDKLLMPKGSSQMGYATAALRAYQQKIHKFSGDMVDFDEDYGVIREEEEHGEQNQLQRASMGTRRLWNVPPTPFTPKPGRLKRLSQSRSMHTLNGSDPNRSKTNRNLHAGDWRNNKSLNVHENPSMEHDLMRVLTSQEILTSYENEDKEFASISLYGEIKLREAFAGTKGMGIPNVQRTAICCHLLFKLNNLFGRYKDMHSLIIVELMRSIYLHYDEQLKTLEKENADPWSVARILETTPYFELIDGWKEKVRKLQHSLDKLTQLRDEADLMAEKRNKVFEMAISCWQQQLLRRCFHNWYTGARISKRQRSMLLRRRTQIWLIAWKKWLSRVKHARTTEEKVMFEKESKSWQEAASDLKSKQNELENEVARLKNLLKKEQISSERAFARETELKFQLDDARTRNKRLMNIVKNSVKKNIIDTKTRIGNIPGTQKEGDESAVSCQKQNLPFWTNLQDIRKIGRQAMNQRDLDIYNASAGGVRRDESESMDGDGNLQNEQAVKAIEQLCKKDATSLIKAWVNYQINNPVAGSMFGDTVPTASFSSEKPPQMRIDNFTSHLRDSMEYSILASNILSLQPVDDRVGGYEIRTDVGDFRLPTPTKVKKKKQIEEEKLAALKIAEDEMKERLHNIFDTMDSSSDGNLTQTELLQAIHENESLSDQLRAHPQLSPLLVPALWEAVFADTDANNDGVITFDEFLKYAYGIKAGKGLCEQIFNLLDDQKSGKVSRVDILGAVGGRGSARVTALLECHPDLRTIMDPELWEADFEKALNGELISNLQLHQFEAWLDTVLQTQHEKEVHMESQKKQKEAEKQKAADRKVEILLTRENFKQKVLEELDTGQRAARLLYGLRTWLGPSFPNVIIEPEEIHLADAEWNFTALANMFVQHSSLFPDQLPFVTSYHDIVSLEAQWNRIINASKSSDEDPTLALETLSARINGISDKVHREIQGLEEGHNLWWKCARTVMSRLVNDLCRRARGIEGTIGAEEIDREKGSFMKLSYMKMQQLFVDEENPTFSFQEVTDYIGESFMELRKVYKAYGSMGGGGSTMSMAEFLMLVRDCKLVDKKFTTSDVDLIFIKTNIEVDEVTGDRVAIAMNPDKALTTTEFVEAVVRVAHGFYRPRMKGSPLIDCLRRVMEDHIVPFAKRSDAEAFRKKLASPELRGVFQRHGDRLKALFDKYSKADDSDMHEDRAAETMNLKEFMQLMKDKKLLGTHLPHKTVQTLFQNVQNDDAAFEEEDDDMDAEVDYDEFVESVAACACIVFPNPYVAFEQRIERFILSKLLVGEKREKSVGKGAKPGKPSSPSTSTKKISSTGKHANR